MGRRSFPGGIISSTEPSVTGYGASGMWTTQTAAQKKNAGLWPLPGITPSGPLVGPTIANVAVTDSNYTILNDTPYIDSGGGYIKVTGTGFASGAIVYVGGSAAVTTSFISSTEVRAQIGAGSTSNAFPVYVVNTDSSVAIKLAAVAYSGSPTWSTAAALSNQVVDAAFSIALSATSDSAITYSLAAGSSLPAGTALSSGGVFSGTVTGLIDETTYSFSVVANDAENQDASRTFTVTVSVGDQYFYLTPLLLNGDANVWIRDSSVNNLLPTISGDTRPVAFSPYNTTWSAYFDGTSTSYLNAVSNAAFAFGTGDFTLEAWIFLPVYPSAGTVAGQIISAHNWNGSGFDFGFRVNTAGPLYFEATGGANVTSTIVVPLGQWNHVACVRNSGTVTFYINGLSRGSASITTNIPSTTAISLGHSLTGGTYGALTGYISNARVVKGVPVYTGNFIPQTSSLSSTQSSSTNIAAITGTSTSLLTLQDNRFKDNSVNAFTLTSSATQIKSFGPFADTDTTTGSGYFDGTGDYLTVANNTALQLGSGDFTIEFWAYPTAVGGGTFRAFVSKGAASTGWSIFINSSGNWAFTDTSTPLTSSLAVANAWTHVAAVRVGTAFTLYLNGVSSVTATVSTNFNQTDQLVIGAGRDTTIPIIGYIADLRVLKGTALYTANFTPTTTTLTAVANTQLLTLQYRRGDNNHRFVDESGIKSLTTRAGNAHQGSFSPFSPAGWSGYFDGSTSYLNSSTIGTLSGTWTVEFWIYMPVLGVQYTFINLNSGGAGGVNIWRNTSNQLVVDDGANAQTAFSTVTFATAGVWYHVAVTRNGTTTTGYINGAIAGTNTFTPASVNAVTIGRYNNNPFYYLLGYMSNLRVVDGVVVYTGAFTPPTTALTATQSAGTNIAAITVGQTLLLTLQNNRFVDNSATPKTLTRTGSLFIQAFSPFRGSGSYSPATHGGSAYFDGSGDYITIVNSPLITLGTSNHTVEFWMYPNGTQGNYSVVWEYSLGSTLQATNDYYFAINNVGTAITLLLGGGGSWAVDIQLSSGEYTAALNRWNHVVITRSGTAFRLFLDGVLKGYATSSQSIAAQAAGTGIGDDGANNSFKGYVSNFNMIVGSIPAAYQTASTTTGTSIFTPPTAPSAITANTVAYTNFTNGGIVDATGRTTFETVADTKISNVASKFGAGSLYFDGTGDYLKFQVLPIYAFGTGDFTFECWIYMNSYNATSGSQLFGGHVFGVSADYIWYIDTTGKMGLQITASTAGRIVSTSSVPLTTWTHVAVVRYNGIVTPYINGTNAGGAGSYTTTMPITTAPTIGSDSTGNTGFSLNGYIDDFRITRYARYTANFTAPTQAFLTK
jgi:hypothetical protein